MLGGIALFAYVAWFADRRLPAAAHREWQARALRHLAKTTPASWREHTWGGRGWRLVVRHGELPGWRWNLAERQAGLSVVAAGLPVGLPVGSALEAGRGLLDGKDLHLDVVPPFGLIAVDDTAGRLAVQQDWYGMGQVFHYRRPGLVAVSSRPSLLPETFGDPVEPDEVGWSYYLGNSAFAGSSSPVRGVRLLHAGERITGDRDAAGRWRLRHELRAGVEEVVADGAASRAPLDEVVDEVAAGISRVGASLARHYRGPVRLGLSGGKDSRLIAAALLSVGTTPVFETNEENPVEGETARTLTSLLRERRGLDVQHELYVATPRPQVLGAPVPARAAALARRHDFMFASTYLNRPVAVPPPAALTAPSLTGALGEALIDVWVPREWVTDPASATPDGAREILERTLTRTVAPEALTPHARGHLHDLVTDVVARAARHGLDPFGTVAYGYLLGRMRRACTALTNLGQVMPLAIPEVFRASFRLTPAQKARRDVHRAVIGRLVPEWAEVPFVSYRTGVRPANVLRIWHGSGEAELAAVLDEAPGAVTAHLDRPAVRASLGRAGRGRGGNAEDALLRQFAMAAVADGVFAPDDVPPLVLRARSLADRHPVVGRAVGPVGRRLRDAGRAATRVTSASAPPRRPAGR